MAVIAINQQFGSSGIELARRVAQRLAYRLTMGTEIIAAAAERYRVSVDRLLIVDERRPNFWERVRTDSTLLYSYFRAETLREMARDKVVIVGRTIAQHLPDLGCGLRVRTVAPLVERIKKVAEEERLTLSVAERRVRDHDREIRDRIMTLNSFDLDDPGNYHLTLNVFSAPLEASVDAIAAYVRHIDLLTDTAVWQMMRDLVVEAQVEAAGEDSKWRDSRWKE